MTDGSTPVILVVRDGWGRNPHVEHDAFNAVKLAQTPCNDALLEQYPWTLIHTSGEDVGLPAGTMGNSEVGHQNLGAGRIVDQESVRISNAISNGDFFTNDVLRQGVSGSRDAGRWVHLLGLASDAGVHALLDHLYACIEACRRLGQTKVALHLLTDGRDTGPFTGMAFVAAVEAECQRQGVGQVASISGRYWTMDRDNRWERVQCAYDMLTGRGTTAAHFASSAEALQDYYDSPTNDSQLGDEFVTPRTVGDAPEQTRIADGDTVIFFNYRGDRPREITRAFVMPKFYGAVAASPDSGVKGFERGPKLDLTYLTMSSYEEELGQWVDVIFPKPPKLQDIAGELLSTLGLTQFRCAETEKFPHVTFFFNDYREKPFPGEARQMAQSPKMATYDLQPQMSAEGVCQLVLDRLAADDCQDLIVVNFANGDMVGHTGKLDAAIAAIQTVDTCQNRIIDAALKRGGALLLIADHGNAEQMYDPQTQSPHTAHTTYDVECILVDPKRQSATLRPDGRLADVMPTLLEMMGVARPDAMTGRSLLEG
jgi:2,3-bisphosphoglycerate-independent phosphoglycerate mutase